MKTIKLLDVVALIEDLPKRHLQRGQVDTVVEHLAEDVYEVEFSDTQGRPYDSFALHAHQIMRLHYEPLKA